jgi:hypothetical protein
MYPCGRKIVLSQARVAVRLLYLGLEGVLPDLRFPCKIAISREPRSGLVPLTSSLYEFACVRSSLYSVRPGIGLFRGLWMIWGYRFVRCVPVHISPVAVRSRKGSVRERTFTGATSKCGLYGLGLPGVSNSENA